jgi:phosphoribosyl 1,2-cyclic phosphodiesterase
MDTVKYGGNTSCVELRHGKSLFILDAGTGIRPLGDLLMTQSKGGSIHANVFITHSHWDHIQGFPFFVPAYIKGNRFLVHGAHGMGHSFEEVFRGLMSSSYFPVDLGDMAAKLDFVEMSGQPYSCEKVRVDTTYTNHPGMNIAYRFVVGNVSITYLTDHETYQLMNQATEFARKQDQLIEDFCRNTNLLICDSQYTDEEYKTKRGWGHSRYQDTVRLALASGASRLALFHHDPAHSDDQLDKMLADAKRIIRDTGKDLECFLAKEGQQIEI